MKALKILFLVVILHLVNPLFYSQVTQQWVQRYKVTDTHNQYSYFSPFLTLDRAGNIFICGTVDSDTSTSEKLDFMAVKYNSLGVQQWIKYYDGPSHLNDNLKSVKVDYSGNLYLSGYIDNGSSSHIDICIVKYNSTGVQQWVFIYDSPEHYNDNLGAIDVDINGNVCLSGYCSASSGNNKYLCTIKISSSGSIVWVKTDFHNILGISAQGVCFDNSGNIIDAISILPFEMTSYSLFKYNSYGDSLWVTECGSSRYYGNILGVICNSSNELFTVINTNPYFPGYYNWIAYKVSNSGNQVWYAAYAPISNTQANSFKIDAFGNLYTTGVTSESPGGYFTTKINATGQIQWTKKYNFNGNSNTAADLDIDKNNFIYVTGSSQGISSNSDYATIKYNPAGDSLWVIRYNFFINDYASAIKVDTLGNVYVTGSSVNSDGTYSYATIKYVQMVGIKPISTIVPISFDLSQNYPNPFNPTTKIKFDVGPPLNPLLRKEGTVVLRIYDVLGKEVVTLVNEQLNPGTYEVEWDASNYPSGVYFFKLITGNYSETKKLILLK
jgi:hypothetical protein